MSKPRKFVCDECGYKARDNYNLTVHKRSHVPNHLKCRFCKTPHSSEAEAKRHEDTCNKYVTCFYCRRKVRDKATLIAHIDKIHNSHKKPSRLQCPLCSNRFTNCDSVEIHLSQDHHTSLEKTHLNFDKEEDFYQWKTDVETSSQCAFTKQTSRSHSDKKYVYFYCYRSGSDKMIPLESRKRRPKSLGSNKMNAYCPARITVRVERDGKVYVTFVSTHVGHDFEVTRLRLPPSYRKSLAVKMKMKIPLDEIIASEREEAKERSQQQIQRSLFLKRHDLYNIARDFGVQSDVVFRLKDSSTVRKSTKKKREAGSPLVRYYKSFNDDTDPAYPEHQDKQVVEVCGEYNTEPFCDPSIVIESVNEEFVFSENPNSEEEQETLHEILSHPTSISQKVEDEIIRFAEIARSVTNNEQLAAVNDAVSSLGATLAVLQQTEDSTSPTNKAFSPQKGFEGQKIFDAQTNDWIL